MVIKNGLSVRQTEKIIKKATFTKTSNKRPKKQQSEELPSSYKNAMVIQLTNRLNSKVAINTNGSRGKIEIEYYSLDDLDRVVAMLLNEQ